MTFAEKLKKERERLGLTQPELASVFENDNKPVSQSVLWNWEHGTVEPFDVTQEGVLARLKKIKKRG